jgi:phosphate starvation-inducible PhoH-like protein
LSFSEPDVFIKKEFVPLTKAQKDYWNAIDQNIITISVGAAGTGKSYVAIAYAADELIDKRIHKIVFTRAGVECGENYGFLPGELDEKLRTVLYPN